MSVLGQVKEPYFNNLNHYKMSLLLNNGFICTEKRPLFSENKDIMIILKITKLFLGDFRMMKRTICTLLEWQGWGSPIANHVPRYLIK